MPHKMWLWWLPCSIMSTHQCYASARTVFCTSLPSSGPIPLCYGVDPSFQCNKIRLPLSNLPLQPLPGTFTKRSVPLGKSSLLIPPSLHLPSHILLCKHSLPISKMGCITGIQHYLSVDPSHLQSKLLASAHQRNIVEYVSSMPTDQIVSSQWDPERSPDTGNHTICIFECKPVEPLHPSSLPSSTPFLSMSFVGMQRTSGLLQ